MFSIALFAPRGSLCPVTAQVTGWLCVRGLSAATATRQTAAHS
ncbi:MAG TPA: hypothetical protein VFZ28_18060 [Burkholderiaceae bacterium]|nr:hypothetical protein [Burkholderiaceae bacterium]